MHGWETLLGVLGGLVLGLGLGVLLGRRAERGERRAASADVQRLRTTVVPILEQRAAEVGVPPEERRNTDPDPVAVSISLAEGIRRHQDHQTLPFSDTLELSAKEIRKDRGSAA